MVDILQGVAILALVLSHLLTVKELRKLRVRYENLDRQVWIIEEGYYEEP